MFSAGSDDVQVTGKVVAINYVNELYGNTNIKWFALLFPAVGGFITYGGITMALKKNAPATETS